MDTQEISLSLGEPGLSQAVAIGITSAQSAAIFPVNALSPTFVVVTPTVDCFVRQGTAPTAVSDGTDLFLLGQGTYRLSLPPGNKLAFKTTGATGTVYLTPRA